MSISALTGKKGEKYGLILAPSRQKKRKKLVVKNAFGASSSDDEGEMSEMEIRKQVERSATRGRNMKKTKKVLADAQAQDPTIFEYDEIHDELRKGNRKRRKHQIKSDKPKYIPALMKKAQERERDRDLIFENKLIREMEEDKKLWGETERFITPSYKKQLEENKKWKNELEEKYKATDVTKTGMVGFYSSMIDGTNSALGGGYDSDSDSEKEMDRIIKQAEQEEQARVKKLNEEKSAETQKALEEEKKRKDEEENKLMDELLPALEPYKKRVERPKETPEQRKVKFQRRNSDKSIMEARARYLQRQQEKQDE